MQVTLLGLRHSGLGRVRPLRTLWGHAQVGMPAGLGVLMLTLMMVLSLGWSVCANADIPPLQDFDGQPRDIETYLGDGRWLVVKIWAHDCHVCNMEAEYYAYFHETHGDAKAAVLGISMDGLANQSKAAAFIERHDLPYPNLIGEPLAVMRFYMQQIGSPFRGTPTILIYDPSGTLRAAQAGAVPIDTIESFIDKNTLPPSAD